MGNNELGLQQQADVVQVVLKWNRRGLTPLQIQQLCAAQKTLNDLVDLQAAIGQAATDMEVPEDAADQFADRMVSILHL